jgi:hypothetical protein
VTYRNEHSANGKIRRTVVPWLLFSLSNLAPELVGETLDQPAAEPRIGASEIDARAVVGDVRRRAFVLPCAVQKCHPLQVAPER